MPTLVDLVEEADRQFTICNACRYCQDYCAVFPAMERRIDFDVTDISQLASLCHDCRSCYQACMYTEPHEFAINIPRLMSEARTATYEHNARPRWLHRAFASGPLALFAAIVAIVAVILLVYLATASLSDLFTGHGAGSGSLYEVVPHLAMMVPALVLSVFALTTVAVGARTVLLQAAGGSSPQGFRAWWNAAKEIATLRWMKGGGGNCYFPDEERASAMRRYLHHLVAYGFLAALLATGAAWIEETFAGQLPPYPILSVPVVLGLIGGLAMLIGCTGLIVQKRKMSRRLIGPEAVVQDYALLVSLLVVSGTGLLLLLLRSTSAMGILVVVHLSSVFALFLTAPYGKFVHVVYRAAAVLRDQGEREHA